MHGVFFVCALASIFAVVMICIFLFANGIPAIREIGALDFLTGTKWKPGNDIYGILPMIVGSIYITAGAILIGVPVGLLTAVFMAFYCPQRAYRLLKPCTELLAGKWKPGNDIYGILPMIVGSIYITAGAILIGVPVGLLTAVFMAFYCPQRAYRLLKPCTELLAGIPSIVYGFFGMIVIVPAVREVAALFGADISGSSILSASILLGVMILPTIIGVAESALRAVPQNYYEGAVAMGATHERAVFSVMLPAAKSGVLASIVLGVGRAIGETMAVKRRKDA